VHIADSFVTAVQYSTAVVVSSHQTYALNRVLNQHHT
jgi:hypothetical protein